MTSPPLPSVEAIPVAVGTATAPTVVSPKIIPGSSANVSTALPVPLEFVVEATVNVPPTIAPATAPITFSAPLVSSFLFFPPYFIFAFI